jgi:hypothetical protein
MKTTVIYPLQPRPAVLLYQSRRNPAPGRLLASIILSILWGFFLAIIAVGLAASAAAAVAFALGPVIGFLPSCLPAFAAACVVFWSISRASGF